MWAVDTALSLVPQGIVLQSVHPTATAMEVQSACRHKSAACSGLKRC